MAQPAKPLVFGGSNELSTGKERLVINPKMDTSVLGSTGLRQNGGFLSEEYEPALRGMRGRQTFREMADQDPIIGGMVFAFSALFRSVEWHVEAAKNPAEMKPEGDPSKKGGTPPKPTDKQIVQAAQQPPAANDDALIQKIRAGLLEGFLAHMTPKQRETYMERVAKSGGSSRSQAMMALPSTAIGAVSSQPDIMIGEPDDLQDDTLDEETPQEAGARFLEEVLDDMEMPFDSVMEEIASMFVYGFAPLEILYKMRQGPESSDPAKRSKYDDNRIGLRGLPLRAQPTIYRWDIDVATGTILGVWQQPWTGPQVYIPAAKMLLFRTTAERNNPEGRSTLRNAYRPWYFKKRLEEIEAIGVERDLAGLPIVTIPMSYMDPQADNLDKAVFQNYQKLVQSVKRDTVEGIVMPSDCFPNSTNKLFEFKLLSSGGARAFDTTKVIDRYSKEMATSVLADFIFLGQGSTGSFALSADKTDLFAQALGAYLKSVAGLINRQLIPAIWMLNGWPVETMPSMVAGDVAKANLMEIGSFIASMASAGAPMFPDRDLENALRKMAGLPPAPEEGEDLRDGSPHNPQQPAPGIGPDGLPLQPGDPPWQPGQFDSPSGNDA